MAPPASVPDLIQVKEKTHATPTIVRKFPIDIFMRGGCVSNDTKRIGSCQGLLFPVVREVAVGAACRHGSAFLCANQFVQHRLP